MCLSSIVAIYSVLNYSSALELMRSLFKTWNSVILQPIWAYKRMRSFSFQESTIHTQIPTILWTDSYLLSQKPSRMVVPLKDFNSRLSLPRENVCKEEILLQKGRNHPMKTWTYSTPKRERFGVLKFGPRTFPYYIF